MRSTNPSWVYGSHYRANMRYETEKQHDRFLDWSYPIVSVLSWAWDEEEKYLNKQIKYQT